MAAFGKANSNAKTLVYTRRKLSDAGTKTLGERTDKWTYSQAGSA